MNTQAHTDTPDLSEIIAQIDTDEHGVPEMRSCKRNTLPCPAWGLDANISFEDYCKIDAFNASTGKKFMLSGLHGAAYLEQKQDNPTNAMLFGTACHMALFEPEKFAELAIDGTGSGNKPLANECAWSTHKACQEKNPGKVILHDGWRKRILGVCEAVRRHKDGQFLFHDPNLLREVTLIWREPFEIGGRLFQIPCKARLDLFSPLGQCIPDMKVTGDASAKEFHWNAYKLGYYQSGGFYKQAAWRCGLLRKQQGQLPSQPYVMLAVERESVTGDIDGHLAGVYAYTDADLDQGFDELMSVGMTRYLAYRLAGYRDAPAWCNSVNPLSIPTREQNENQPRFVIGAES
jgi:hypothetical protein